MTSLAEGGIYGTSNGRIIDSEIALLLGKVYTLASLLLEDYSELEQFVEEHPYLFSEQSNLIKASEKLGNMLMNTAQGMNREIDYSDAYDNAILCGSPHDQAHKIELDVTKDATDLYMDGEELVWLSKVLPEAALGNWYSFNNTGTDRRLILRPIWIEMKNDPFFESILVSNAEIDELIKNSDYISIEYIATLAMLSGI